MTKKVFLIDAYDSFVYMLYQYFGSFGCEVKVVRNDTFTPKDIMAYDPDCIVLSPGPGHPKDSNFIPVINEFEKTPIFGVCLGHQAMGLAFGAKISIANKILHGKTSFVQHDGKSIFSNLPNPFSATRYHSLVVSDLPKELVASAKSTDDGEIMALRHATRPMEGVQFHPESIMTQNGKDIIRNFLDSYCR